MRIVVLAHNLWCAGGLSVGKSVIAALPRAADEHEYLLIMPTGAGYEELPKPTRATSYHFQRTGRVSQGLFERFKLPRIVHEFRPDAVWGLGNCGLRKPGAVQAILVMQPQLLYEAKYQRGVMLRERIVFALARRRLAKVLPHTPLIFCQTEAAAGRFRRFMNYKGRIAVMPPAVSDAAKKGDPGRRPAVFDRLSGKRVLFCLTRYYAHKNLEALVEAFRRCGDTLQDVAVIFTVAPDHHPYVPGFLRSLEEPGLRDRLVNVGPIPQEELAGYYAACDALILPTLLESFSSAYLEAMEYERPILTSDIDFARAACGPAAHYFDPFDPSAIRDTIVEYVRSPELREKLVAAGIERRKSFVRDWDSIVSEALGEITKLV